MSKEISYSDYQKYLNIINTYCRKNGDIFPDLANGFKEEELRKKYRFLVKKYHPDLHPDINEALTAMQEINLAYEELKKVLDGVVKVTNPVAQNSYQSTQNPYQNAKYQNAQSAQYQNAQSAQGERKKRPTKKKSKVEELNDYKNKLKSIIENLSKDLGSLDDLSNYFQNFKPHNMVENKLEGIPFLNKLLRKVKYFKQYIELFIKTYSNFIDFAKTKEEAKADYENLIHNLDDEINKFISEIISELKGIYKYFDQVKYDINSLKEYRTFGEFASKIQKYINYVDMSDYVQNLLANNKEKREKNLHNISTKENASKVDSENPNKNIKQYKKNMISKLTSEIEKIYLPGTFEYKSFMKLWGRLRFLDDYNEFFNSYVDAMLNLIESKFYKYFYDYDEPLKKEYKKLYFELLEALSQFENGALDIGYLDMFYSISFTDYQKDAEILSKIKNFSYIDDLKFFIDTTKDDSSYIYYAKSFGDKIIAERMNLMPFEEDTEEEVYSGSDFVRNFVSLDSFFANGETVNKSIGNHSKMPTLDSIAKIEYKGLVLCLVGDTSGKYLRFTTRDKVNLTDDVYTLYNLRNLLDDTYTYQMVWNYLSVEVKRRNLDEAIENKKESLSSRGVNF